MKKRIVAVLLAVIMTLGVFTWQAFSVFAAPRSILDLASKSGNTYTLNNDIDLTYEALTTVELPAGTIFDGNNHIIKNATISDNGLFSNVAGTIRNLGVYNAVLSTTGAEGKSYGIIAGNVLNGANIEKCFATGKVAVYDGGSAVGGLIGSFDGTMSQCFGIVDIYSNRANLGGLVGNALENAEINNCYTTGSIHNETRDFVGGLVGGSSAQGFINNSYSSVFIANPYADTVEAIAQDSALGTNVYYDKTISLQRQGDLDEYGKTPDELNAVLTNGVWLNTASDLYPQLDYFRNNTNDAFKSVSAISVARVDLHLNNFINGTGREYTTLSTISQYNYATLSTTDVLWHISGIDEYFFDPAKIGTSPTVGGRPDGLSGFTYDGDNGKYLFTVAGDISFTAENSGYSRTISVHVTNRNPYFSVGNGTSLTPYLISNINELENVRLFVLCGEYNYKLNTDIELSGQWNSISYFKGSFDGNEKKISKLVSTQNTKENRGFIGSVTGLCDIKNLHLESVEISNSNNVGGLIGYVDTDASVSIQGVAVSGSVCGTNNSAMLIGKTNANANINVSQSSVTGYTNSKNAGSFLGTGKASLTDCFSSAVVYGTEYCGGLIGNGVSGSQVVSSVYVGMLDYNAATTKNPIANANCSIDSYTKYDKQSTGINGGMTSAELSSFKPSSNWEKKEAENYYQLSNILAMFPYYSYIATAKVDYSVGDSSLTATSKVFENAVLSKSENYSVDVYGTDIGGYIYESANNLFTINNGGKQMYIIRARNNLDDRYLLFNVRAAKIYYRFTGTGLDDYELSAKHLGFGSFINEVGFKYNCKLDTNYTEYVEAGTIIITPSTDVLKYKIIEPGGYSFITNVYSDRDETISVKNSLEDSFIIPDSDKVYIKIDISKRNIWGNYSLIVE